ncbi:MAG: phage portal protein [Desulfovibrio sp.]|nr:phage portal protein [Desulfovibrio sp.]
MNARAVARRRAASPAAPGRVPGIALTAGGYHGTMGNWFPHRQTEFSASRERSRIQARADDLAGNDPNAASLIGGMTVNIVGTGIRPQSTLSAARLGISEEAAARLRDAIEREFARWACRPDLADAGNRLTFWQIQSLNLRTAMVKGEFLNLCVDRGDPYAPYSLALQVLSPLRLITPGDLTLSPHVRDGVHLGARGEPVGYYIANPDPLTGRLDVGLAANVPYYKAREAWRPVTLHAFPQIDEEQVRGVSILAPAMKLFRDLADYMDYELVGQIITAAFPVVIESDQPVAAGIGMDPRGKSRLRPAGREVREIEPGSVLHLYPGERGKTLDAPRPNSNFDMFVARHLRSAGASAGMPYEVGTKDFSKTNYSSARAALIEAWRVFQRYQSWLESAFCRPVWEAEVEEAFARGYIEIPEGAPPFLDAREDYLAARWVPPRRGHVDPVKEIEADIMALEAGIKNYSEVIETHSGDWETAFAQRAREERRIAELGLSFDLSGRAPDAAPGDETEEATDAEK